MAGFTQREAGPGHGAWGKGFVWAESFVLFGWCSDEQGQQPWWELEDCISLCTAARQHSVLANPKHPGLPLCAQGWFASSGRCCMLHTRALSSSLEPEGIHHRVLPWRILLGFHLTQNTRNFCFQPSAAASSFWSPYGVPTLQYSSPVAAVSSSLLKHSVYIHCCVFASQRDFSCLGSRGFKNISYHNTFDFIKPLTVLTNEVKQKEVENGKVLRRYK